MILEVCVDSTASALAAKRGGADRLELCADLIVGGTTPSLALVRQVKAETGLPVRALLRPRFGGAAAHLCRCPPCRAGGRTPGSLHAAPRL